MGCGLGCCRPGYAIAYEASISCRVDKVLGDSELRGILSVANFPSARVGAPTGSSRNAEVLRLRQQWFTVYGRREINRGNRINVSSWYI